MHIFLDIETIPAQGAGVREEIAAASEVEIDTYRVSAGVDYVISDGVSVYFRYNFYDYLDQTAAYNTGEAHMFLGGLTAIF